MSANNFFSSVRSAWSRRAPRRVALGLVFAASVVACSRAGVGQQVASSVPPAPAVSTAAPVGVVTSYADVVSRVAPAVVTVRSEMRVRPAQQMPFMDDPFFRQFFGDRVPREQQPPQREEGVGSGVIVSADGYILTNHHVIDGAQQIKVELTDRRVLDAKVVGSDKPSDLAVLKIDATGLPVLPLGDSDRVRVGDVVLAVGNPLDIGQTVTSGIVSAKGRQTSIGDGSFADFIQTDAAINRGNSGGALVNTSGELVGINSQIVGSPTGGNIGIGFAIPSNMAKGVMDQLLKTGKVRRGQLGIIVQPVTSDIAQSLDLKEIRGVIVSQVQQGSAADSAGIRQGDVITALNGTPVNDSNELRNRVASTQPGTDVTLDVLRDGRQQQIRARLGEYKAPNSQDERAEGGDTGGNTGSGKLGVSVEPVTPEIARQLQLRPGETGVVVGEVDPNGPAADAGIQQGDVIEQINRQPVRSASDIASALQRAGSRPVLLLVSRRGQTVFLTVHPRQ